jgi:hypothetical protein
LLKLKEVRENLSHYKELNALNDTREKIFDGIVRVDAVEKFEQEETDLKRQIDDIPASPGNSGFVIVVCQDPDSANTLTQSIRKNQRWKICRIETEDPLSMDNWEVRHASSPDDIMWENIGHNRRLMGWKNGCRNFILIIVLLFLFTPAYLVKLVLDTFSDIGIGASIISSYIPSLVILIYIEVLIPAVIDYMVDNEKHYRKSDEVHSSVQKYISILVFMVFGAGLIGL